MKPPKIRTHVTDAHLDTALAAEHDQILPSSGFADSVMTAVHAQAAAPAPIPFPWKRAIPGLVGIAGGIVLLVGFITAFLVSFARAGIASSSGKVDLASGWKLEFSPLLHYVTAPDAAWITLALAIPLISLLALRRLLFSR